MKKLVTLFAMIAAFVIIVLIVYFFSDSKPKKKWISTDKIWGDKQCANIGSGNGLANCKAACLNNPSCTAFNYKIENGDCVYRACQKNDVGKVPDPEWAYPGWQGWQ